MLGNTGWISKAMDYSRLKEYAEEIDRRDMRFERLYAGDFLLPGDAEYDEKVMAVPMPETLVADLHSLAQRRGTSVAKLIRGMLAREEAISFFGATSPSEVYQMSRKLPPQAQIPLPPEVNIAEEFGKAVAETKMLQIKPLTATTSPVLVTYDGAKWKTENAITLDGDVEGPAPKVDF